MFAIVLLINWSLINLIGRSDGGSGREKDVKVLPGQPFENSARIGNSLQHDDLKSMFLILTVLQIYISTV